VPASSPRGGATNHQAMRTVWDKSDDLGSRGGLVQRGDDSPTYETDRNGIKEVSTGWTARNLPSRFPVPADDELGVPMNLLSLGGPNLAGCLRYGQ